MVRTVEWRMVLPIEEARVRLCAAAEQLGMDARSSGDRVMVSAARAWSKNRWAAEIEITLRAAQVDATAAVCRVEMAGNKHYAVLNELAAAIGEDAFDDRGVRAAVEELGTVRRIIGRRQIRRLRDLVLADENVLALGHGVYRSRPGLVVLTNRRLFLLEAGSVSESFEEFALASITSLESTKSPGGERLVIHTPGGTGEIKQLIHGQGDAIARRFRKTTTRAPASAAAPALDQGPAGPRRAPDGPRGMRERGPTHGPRESEESPTTEADTSTMDRDLFISHASEDKEAVARPLAAALEERGWSVCR